MKLNFRDLKQQKFTIDVEPSETISEVKEKIAQEKGWEASTQKLIYSGKILADANTVESYKIEEKGFIVCMVSKPKTQPAKPAAAAPVPQTPAVSASTPAPPPAPQAANVAPAALNPPATPTPAQNTSSTTTAAPTEAERGFGDPSAMMMGNRNERAIQEMQAMGFPRSEIDRALRAAYYNPDRAIEYLLTGIPEGVAQEQQQRRATPAAPTSPTPQRATATQQEPAQTQGGDEPINLFEAAAQAGQQGQTRGAGAGAREPTAAAAGGDAGQGQVNMDFLRSSPHFQQLRQLVQQQPHMLEQILQQVAENNPQLAQMIGQNQEQFLQLLSEDFDAGEDRLPPGAIPIHVSREERDAIDRLCGLGFSREAVIQAYFACDKNEEMAANLLFDQPEDEDPPM